MERNSYRPVLDRCPSGWGPGQSKVLLTFVNSLAFLSESQNRGCVHCPLFYLLSSHRFPHHLEKSGLFLSFILYTQFHGTKFHSQLQSSFLDFNFFIIKQKTQKRRNRIGTYLNHLHSLWLKLTCSGYCQPIVSLAVLQLNRLVPWHIPPGQ